MRDYFADIVIMELEEFIPLKNKKVLDVGGAQGQFCKVLSRKRECNAINLDPEPTRYLWPKPKNIEKHIWPNTRIAFADDMPFGDNEFDIGICRGVLEHIPNEKQQQSLNEMYRVTKFGGFFYIMIPPWYNPHAGHKLKPFHILPFNLAKHMRRLVFSNKVKASSLKEMELFPITFRRMLEIIAISGFDVVSTKDTHLRLHFLTKIPIIREIAVPAVAFILKKK
jgi:ubiquinone/menaquinone biosynthesis C-methylase UbiE